MKTIHAIITLTLAISYSIPTMATTGVVSTRGMVVCDDREAAEWGTEILRRGGNAMDAAVATAFAMAVTRPHYASIGGGGMMVYCPYSAYSTNDPKSLSTCQGLDYRETAPAAATADLYIKNGKLVPELSKNGALASGTPGVVAGLLTALDRFGTKDRKEILSRPIQMANDGFKFTALMETVGQERWPHMNTEAQTLFGCKPVGSNKLVPCAPGTVVKQVALSKTLTAISKNGIAGFYEGKVANSIVDGLKEAGGVLTLADLKGYQPVFREVLRGKYRGMEINTMPPPSAGGVILFQLLGYAERANQQSLFRTGPGSTETIHALAHAMSLAFADRVYYYGDPDFVKIPMSTLLSSAYLDERWKTFRKKQALLPKGPGAAYPVSTPSPHPIKEDQQDSEPSHTTHLSVIDRHGNAVSLTTTINDNFGSGFVPPGTGIVMNNQMDDFSGAPGMPNIFGLIGDHANSIAARKRPLSSMTPTIVRDDRGRVRTVIGAAGGPRITTSTFLSLFNQFQFRMPLPDAVSAARFHHQWRPETLKLESYSFPAEVRTALRRKGYELETGPTLGKVHGLEVMPDGRVIGIADPRGEGAAVAE